MFKMQKMDSFMSKFKIGDKVCFVDFPDKFVGYVSNFFKGHFFEIPDHEIDIHIGEQKHIIKYASELEHFKDE